MHASESLASKLCAPAHPRIFNLSSRVAHSMAHAGVYALPVELLARIFELGREDAPSPDLQPPGEPTFEVLVSHVCQHWRDVALRTPTLWTLVHFRTTPHLARARAYLSRSGSQPLQIYVDTCAKDEYVPGWLLFRDEFHPVFDTVVPHIARWRSLYLKVRDLACKRSARDVLSTCGAAPRLASLTLWHIEDWGTSERLYTAIGPPPVVVFAGRLPALRHVHLIGVNLPWSHSPFLRGLASLELALHSDDVRIPFDRWHAMLAASPALERLSLTYSGPRAAAPPWGPPARVRLPRLRELRLTDLDPPYLCALVRTLDAPALRTLHLELSDQDFTPFVRMLARPPPPSDGPLDPSLPYDDQGEEQDEEHEEDDEEGHADDEEGEGRGGEEKGEEGHGGRGPLFPALETLSIAALECTLPSLRALLAGAPRVRHLDAAFARMPRGALELLARDDDDDGGGVEGEGRAGVEGRGGRAGREGAGEEGRGRAGAGRRRGTGPLLLPALTTARLAGVDGAALRRLMRARGRAVRTWYVHERWWDEECERLMVECERAGAARVEWFEGEEGEEGGREEGGEGQEEGGEEGEGEEEV